jgi:AcrR family transcriptional regulator
MKDTLPYHHGNLKQALLDASIDLIREVGPEAFTLREVARVAGVSHNAPYRHFRDKSELLAAVAAAGFDRLTESMTKAADSGSDALGRFRLSGRGYVQFALHYPQHFTVMFEAPQGFRMHPEALAAGERAFTTLVRCIEQCQSAGSLPRGDSKSLALLAWSMVHGVAKLAVAGRLPFSRSEEILQFTDTATHALMHGISNASGLKERHPLKRTPVPDETKPPG